MSVTQAIDQVTSAVHGTSEGARPGRLLVKWQGAGESAIGQLVIYDGSTNARESLNELTTALTALYDAQPAPADVAAILKERGFVDAAGALAASRE